MNRITREFGQLRLAIRPIRRNGMNELEQVAVISGAGRGIGATAGMRLLDAGFYVYFSDTNFERAKEFAANLDSGQERAFPVLMEVTSDDSVNAAISTIGEKHGHINVLINNAGTTDQKPTQDILTEDWNRLIDIHLGGTFRCARAAFPFLKASKRSSIINVSSIAGRLGMPIRASYCAAKAGIEGFTRSLASEWAEFGIRVNAVAPGYIATDLIQKDLANGLVSEEKLNGRISMKRLGRPDEIAEVMFFLATESSSYMTGQVLNVDGGLSIDLNPGSTSAIPRKH
jgi:NAD(P)-dependent dehydrogenase (short-subunit alcohol dehydrogenase family)